MKIGSYVISTTMYIKRYDSAQLYSTKILCVHVNVSRYHLA